MSARLLALLALVGVVGGLVLDVLGFDAPTHLAWAATTALLLVPLTISVTRTLLRGDVGVDAIALVSMAGALALGEYLAGAVIALMLAGGNALEEAANRLRVRGSGALDGERPPPSGGGPPALARPVAVEGGPGQASRPNHPRRGIDLLRGIIITFPIVPRKSSEKAEGS